MTVVHNSAPWQTCRRHAGYLSMYIYKDPPPPGSGFSTKHPDRVQEVEKHWEQWDEENNHSGSGLVARLYKLKTWEPSGDTASLCPPCLAYRGTDFHDMRGMAISASVRWRIFGLGWTHDFNIVLDETVPKKTVTRRGRNADPHSGGSKTVEVSYTREELIALGFRPFPILHDEGTVSALTADNRTHFNFNIRCGLDLMAQEDGDWVANILQGLGHSVLQYNEGNAFAKKVVNEKVLPNSDKRIEVTGHSLGGSLAASATCVLDNTFPDVSIHGTTYNAAGLHENTVSPATPSSGDIHNFTVEDEILTTVHSFTDNLPVVGGIFRMAERTINQVGMPRAAGQLLVQRGAWPPETTHPGESGTDVPNLFPITTQSLVSEYSGNFPVLTRIDAMLASAGNVTRFGNAFIEWLNDTYRDQAIQNNRDSEENFWFPERIDRTYREMARLLMEDMEPEIDALMKIVLQSVEFHGMDYVISAYDKAYGRP